MGEERAAQLAAGEAPWTTATGLVVRGYVSRIDKSVQPYGLVVPENYTPAGGRRWRLDTWFHGRDETLTQVNFLTARMKSMGEFTPPDTIVLHLYGRYCNASKFAGEVDFFEALEAVKRNYAIDESRIVDRGFSMGGASVWHFAVHYPSLWAAASPGAGFAESAQYLKIKLTGDDAPPWWEQKLWHYYDSVDYAANLSNLPVIEYHGEIDPQKQAGDMMERAMAAEGLTIETPGRSANGAQVPPGDEAGTGQADRCDCRERGATRDRARCASRPSRCITTILLGHRGRVGKHWERARIDAEVGQRDSVYREVDSPPMWPGCFRSMWRAQRAVATARRWTDKAPAGSDRWTRALPQDGRQVGDGQNPPSAGTAQAARPAGPDRRRIPG